LRVVLLSACSKAENSRLGIDADAGVLHLEAQQHAVGLLSTTPARRMTLPAR
jgi:hypothetical protein